VVHGGGTTVSGGELKERTEEKKTEDGLAESVQLMIITSVGARRCESSACRFVKRDM
jgi:hypothetical protein